MAPFGRERLEFGTVTSGETLRIPGDFSNAVTLVVCLSCSERSTPDGVRLRWQLGDSVDEAAPYTLCPVEDTFGDFAGQLGGSQFPYEPYDNVHTRRFVVPFGPRLYIAVAICEHNSEKEVEGTFDDVIATVFWRGLGEAQLAGATGPD